MHRIMLVFVVSILLLFAVSCSAEPEVVVESVFVEETVEVPVTVEVTRQVEMTVEVTRHVEVTREVPVEVTRIEEVVITATPSSTPEPTATHTPTPVPTTLPPADTVPAAPFGVAGRLLQASLDLRVSIIGFRDGLGGGNCEEVVRHHDYLLAAPSFDVSGASAEVQWAYSQYQVSLEFALDAALGIGQGCREALANQTSFSITQLNYKDIAGKLDRGLQTLNPAIEFLESLTEN